MGLKLDSDLIDSMMKILKEVKLHQNIILENLNHNC